MINKPAYLTPEEKHNKLLYAMLCRLLKRCSKEKGTSVCMFYLAAGQIATSGVWLGKGMKGKKEDYFPGASEIKKPAL